MKSMKNLSMNKMLGSIKRRTTGPGSSSNTADLHNTVNSVAPRDGVPPEKVASDGVKAFCESGGHVKGDEVLFLPPIVDAAESSPAAAEECARVIRKFISKEYYSRPSWQYNAIMLLRILTQNPGQTFTRHLDQKFCDTAKALLRGGKDPNVRQMLMETLDEFEHTRVYDENLGPLIQMWQREKGKIMREYGGRPLPPPMPNYPSQPVMGGGFVGGGNQPQNYFARSHSNNRLPDPVELTSRLEEARTSAKLLEQVVMNTPPAETLDNELIKEFAERCQSASRSIQGYMTSTNPTPDNDTMESLIDTNEQLQTALNQHQRSVLSARKQFRPNDAAEDPAVNPVSANNANVSGALIDFSGERDRDRNGKGKQSKQFSAVQASGSGSGSASASGSRSASRAPQEDPFADPVPEQSNGISASSTGDLGSERHYSEPFNPGFQQAAEGGSGAGQAGGSSSALGATSANKVPKQRNVRDVAIDDDFYDSTAGKVRAQQ